MRSHIFLNLSCILIMVISLSVITVISPMPGRVLAQTNSSEIGKVLVDDIIQALKANDVKKANVHLSIFDQQLQSPSNNSSPVQSLVKVLLNDTNAALKKNDTKGALVHLDLIKQQLGSGSIVNVQSNSTKNASIPQTTKIKVNHPPDAFNQTVVAFSSPSTPRVIDLRGNDIDGDPIKFSIMSDPSHGQLESFNPTTGLITYTPDSDYSGKDSFDFQVTDTLIKMSSNQIVLYHSPYCTCRMDEPASSTWTIDRMKCYQKWAITPD